jgi:predicted AlkP superfamily pyrophosphatase or phosphodiesterase
MSKSFRIGLLAGAFVLSAIPALRLSAHPGPGQDDDSKRGSDRDIRHVLLISIDGMHAVDFANCMASGTCPHLAALGRTGVTYTRTTTSRPSDSFPGLMALVTGGQDGRRVLRCRL